MEWNYRDDLPIYSQLVEQLKRAIVSGEFAPGSRLASVRELAMDAGVNPNTMQRALTELEQHGLVFTQRTAGRFITEDSEVISTTRKQMAADQTKEYMDRMVQLGFKVEEICNMIREEA